METKQLYNSAVYVTTYRSALGWSKIGGHALYILRSSACSDRLEPIMQTDDGVIFLSKKVY